MATAPVKPGVKSSEAWLTAAGLAVTIIAGLLKLITDWKHVATLGIVALLVVAYVLARAFVKRGGAALLLCAALALTACAHVSPEVAGGVATVATVRTIGDAVEVYTGIANDKETAIAAEVIATCKPIALAPPAWKACTDREKATRRAVWDKADLAVATYRQLLAAGGAALGDRWDEAVGELVGALGALGVRLAPQPSSSPGGG